MKINEVTKTGIVKYNGKTYDVFQTVTLDENGRLTAESVLMPRGQKPKKYPKRFIEELNSYKGKAKQALHNFNAILELKPNQDVIDRLTDGLKDEIYSYQLDFEIAVKIYNDKQAKLAVPLYYQITDEDKEPFTV